MPPPPVARTARLGTVWILLFWLLLGAGLYYVFQLQEQRQQDRYQSYTNSVGELVIPRSPDGHFYVKGEINGEPLRFMVDTGASMVVVSDAFADRAGLQGGVPGRSSRPPTASAQAACCATCRYWPAASATAAPKSASA